MRPLAFISPDDVLVKVYADRVPLRTNTSGDIQGHVATAASDIQAAVAFFEPRAFEQSECGLTA